MAVPPRPHLAIADGDGGVVSVLSRDGELLSRHGVFSGGRGNGNASASLLARKNEIAALETELEGLRENADKLSRERNMKVTADDMVLTSGSGEAIGIVIQALTNPGDVVLVEEFVYLGTLNQMKRYDADVVAVKCDNGGIIPESLDSVITEQTANGKTVKYLYTIPMFQNPLGWTMDLERRKQVLEVTGKHGIPIFEDDCYADLRFEGEYVTSFHSLDDTGPVSYTHLTLPTKA